jgi:hypothetical protein
MKNVTLFIFAFLAIAVVLLAVEAGKMGQYRADYQAYTKPGANVEGKQ